MKFFSRGNVKKSSKGGRGSSPQASDLMGQRMTSLNDIDTIYTSPNKQQQQQAPPPSPTRSPHRQQYHHQQQEYHVGPPSPAYGQPVVTTGVSPNGKRVTTTTVRVPPRKQSPKQQRQQQQQQQQLSPKHTTNSPSATSSSMPPLRPPLTENQPDSTTELTRDLVKKFIADIWNRGEIDLIPEVCSPSLRFNGNTGFDRVGHDGLARMVGTIREALEDYHCEIHSMVVEHNKAFCRLRFTGKHTGNLLGYPPTNKVVAWMGATEFTCQNGKILKVWELGDVKSLEEQINPSLKTSGC